MSAPQLDLLSRLPPELVGDASQRREQGIRLSLRRTQPAASGAAALPAWTALVVSRPAFSPLVLPPLPRESDDDALDSLEYAVVDVESTGGSPLRGHRITEFAGVRMRATGEVLEEYSTLINPQRVIPPQITQLTRITPAMVADAPVFAAVAPRIRALLHGAVFVAHNAAFDHRFLEVEFGRLGWSLSGRTLCTVRLARRTVPEVTSRSLDALAAFFGLENEARHRALGDARVTAVLLRRLLERAAEREVSCWRELERLQRRKPRRARKRRANPHSMEEA